MISQTQYQKFLAQHPAPSLSVAERRRLAFQALQEKGLPTKKQELWKYTSLKSVSEAELLLVGSEIVADAGAGAQAQVGSGYGTDKVVESSVDARLSHEQMKQLANLLSDEMINLVLIDGKLSRTLSSEEMIKHHQLALETSDENLQAFKGYDQGLSALFDLAASQAIKLTIKERAQVEKPINLVIATSNHEAHFTGGLQLILEAQPLSRAELLIQQLSLSQSQIENRLVQVFTNLSAGSVLEINSVQHLNASSNYFQQSNFTLNRDTQLKLTEINLGAAISRLNTEVHFESENAQATVNSCHVLSGNQHADQLTSIEHNKGHNTSSQLTKSILAGRANSVFRGRVYIAQHAQKAASEQLNNNLLLSSTAKAQSIPQLEIYADDVKAGHGATTGQLDADELFYFLSRGISKAQAEQMMAEGFVREVAYRCETEPVRQKLQVALQTALESKLQKDSQAGRGE